MRVLLLGGIGYVGGRLAAHLKTQGHYVRVTTRRPREQVPAWLAADEVRQADPLKKVSLASVFDTIDAAVHLAAPDEVFAAAHPQEALEAGKEGTQNILQALSGSARPPAILYLSTFHVYGANARGLVNERTTPAPAHPYAIAKYEGERVMQEFRRDKKLRGLCVRLSNAFGAPAGNTLMRETLVFNDLCRQAVEKRELVLKTTGTQKRNFIPMSDVARALEFLLERGDQWPEDGLMHVGSVTQWSVREVADRIAQATQELLGYRPKITIPANAPAEARPEFEFNVERLHGLGFSYTGDTDEEIRATLAVCQGTVRPHA